MGNDNNQNKILNQQNSIQNESIIISKKNSAYSLLKNLTAENSGLQKQKPPRIATVFRWDGNGKSVYLTGSFCDWHQIFEMEKCEDPINKNNNKFYLTLFLPRGLYQYKFIIDNQWRCNSNFPTCSDKNGNINNVIDLTKQRKEDGTTDFSTSHVTTGPEQKIEDVTKISNFSQFLENKSNINNNNDNDNDFQQTTENNEISKDSQVEFNYKYDFNFDTLSNQKKFGVNNFLEENEENILNDNYSYKKILPLRNQYIDHLILNKKTFKKKNDKNLVSSCSFRYGFKITTIIYYKPKIKSLKNKG